MVPYRDIENLRGGSTIEITQIVEELESISKTATRVPGLRGRAIVDLDRLVGVGEELQSSIPADIQEAGEILKQKESVVNQAHLEARRIKEAAETEARELTTASHHEHQAKVDETEIVKAAASKAEEINQQALQESQEIVQDAQRRAFRIADESEAASASRREGADQYARETLFELEERLAGLLGQVRKGIDALGLETDARVPNRTERVAEPVQEAVAVS